MRHTAYGNLQGRFEATGWSLFKRVWWLWLLVWPSFFILIPLPFLYGALKAIEWRWWVGGIRIGGVSFESSLTGGALIGLYWKVIGWGVLLTIALSAWFGGVFAIALAAVGGAESTQQKAILAFQKLPTLIALGFGYVIIALAVGVIIRIYLMRDVWQRVAESATIHNLAAADDVAAQGHLVSALGEGFADSLDVVGF
jgi:hypothetical protein